MNTSNIRRALVSTIVALVIGGAAFSVNIASADESALPSEFWANVAYCPGSTSFTECAVPTVDGGYWAFHSDASVTRWSNGVEQSDHGMWTEVAPGEVFVEFYNEDDDWLFSVDAEQISGGDYPCFAGLVDDLDIGVLSVRFCLEP